MIKRLDYLTGHKSKMEKILLTNRMHQTIRDTCLNKIKEVHIEINQVLSDIPIDEESCVISNIKSNPKAFSYANSNKATLKDWAFEIWPHV